MAEHVEGVSLREFLELRQAALEARLDRQIIAHGLSHAVSEKTLDRRLEQMNALREQVLAERGLYVTTSILDAKLTIAEGEYHKLAESNAARILLLETQAANLQGRLIASGAILALLLTVAGLVAKLL